MQISYALYTKSIVLFNKDTFNLPFQLQEPTQTILNVHNDILWSYPLSSPDLDLKNQDFRIMMYIDEFPVVYKA